MRTLNTLEELRGCAISLVLPLYDVLGRRQKYGDELCRRMREVHSCSNIVYPSSTYPLKLRALLEVGTSVLGGDNETASKWQSDHEIEGIKQLDSQKTNLPLIRRLLVVTASFLLFSSSNDN